MGSGVRFEPGYFDYCHLFIISAQNSKQKHNRDYKQLAYRSSRVYIALELIYHFKFPGTVSIQLYGCLGLNMITTHHKSKSCYSMSVIGEVSDGESNNVV